MDRQSALGPDRPAPGVSDWRDRLGLAPGWAAQALLVAVGNEIQRGRVTGCGRFGEDAIGIDEFQDYLVDVGLHIDRQVASEQAQELIGRRELFGEHRRASRLLERVVAGPVSRR
jgi:hypothetical protein